ncbi:uncharacterized protein LOC111700084 [Eurytemora carolleeae]|uniref:uncharacterized protein LOC111700084 n=1 Tax=Eurytemora carolleeae TaxID=1294199 RepID=UPI000C79258C|nr:uncharacterized protein LOC111700084 [Eurytemora carolleeae]|eukprot:XP_023326666.1 uncharacterized protein LOC111700084 [Eurytemora affinis]
MTMWADNIKFVKDILDGKYKKIDDAVAEVNENAEILLKEPDAGKSKELFLSAGRTLELMETKEILQLLQTILDDMHEKEKEILETEANSKIDSRLAALEKYKKVKSQLKI